MKVYLITFDSSFTNQWGAHNAITSIPGEEWWHFLSGTYLITSPLNSVAVRQIVQSKWPGGWFLVVEVRKDSNGLMPEGILPKMAWDWINSRITT
jgi:hypothetical protein